MKRILQKVLMLLVVWMPLYAGLTDFKTIKEANEAYKLKAYDKSAALFESLEESNPSKELHYNLGNKYYKKGLYDKAIQEYKLAKGVDEASRQYNLGNSYFKQGNYDKAIKHYQESLKYKDDPAAKNNLELAKKEKKKQKKKQQQKQNKQNKQNKNQKKNDQQKKQNKDQKKNNQNKKSDQKNKQNKELFQRH